MHRSFLPGFDDDLPFVLVDVAARRSRRPPPHRPPARRPGRTARRRCRRDGGVRGARRRRRRSRLRPDRPVTGRFPARNQVAIVGYAQSPIVKRLRPTARRGHRRGRPAGDRRRRAAASTDVDGFTASALLPPPATTPAVDGVTTVSPNWLAAHLGVDPRYATGFQGYGQLPGAVALAVNALASGAADHVLVHRALHNPPGRYHGTRRDAEAPGAGAVDDAAGLLRAAGDDRPGRQRVRAALRRHPRGARRGRRRGPQERCPAAVVVLARPPARPRRVPGRAAIADPVCRFDCDMPVDGVAAFVLTTAERARDLPNRPVYVAGYASGAADPPPPAAALAARRHLSTSGHRGGPAALGRAPGSVRARSTCPSSTTGSRRSSGSGSRCSGFCPVGEAHRFVAGGGIDSDVPGALPGAVGWRRPRQRAACTACPQMLECYLQLVRAGR